MVSQKLLVFNFVSHQTEISLVWTEQSVHSDNASFPPIGTINVFRRHEDVLEM